MRKSRTEIIKESQKLLQAVHDTAFADIKEILLKRRPDTGGSFNKIYFFEAPFKTKIGAAEDFIQPKLAASMVMTTQKEERKKELAKIARSKEILSGDKPCPFIQYPLADDGEGFRIGHKLNENLGEFVQAHTITKLGLISVNDLNELDAILKKYPRLARHPLLIKAGDNYHVRGKSLQGAWEIKSVTAKDAKFIKEKIKFPTINQKPYILENIHRTLIDKIENYHTLPPKIPFRTAERLIKELTCGLDYLHHKISAVHRDLHSGNILISADGHLKIHDFDFSVEVDKDGKMQGNADYRHPPKDYCAPEAIRYAKAKDDQYSQMDQRRAEVYSWAANVIMILSITEDINDEGEKYRRNCIINQARNASHADPKDRPTMAQIREALISPAEELTLNQQAKQSSAAGEIDAGNRLLSPLAPTKDASNFLSESIEEILFEYKSLTNQFIQMSKFIDNYQYAENPEEVLGIRPGKLSSQECESHYHEILENMKKITQNKSENLIARIEASIGKMHLGNESQRQNLMAIKAYIKKEFIIPPPLESKGIPFSFFSESKKSRNLQVQDPRIKKIQEMTSGHLIDLIYLTYNQQLKLGKIPKEAKQEIIDFSSKLEKMQNPTTSAIFQEIKTFMDAHSGELRNPYTNFCHALKRNLELFSSKKQPIPLENWQQILSDASTKEKVKLDAESSAIIPRPGS